MTTAPKKHAKFSASSAYRWLACPGSVALCEKAPPSPDSPASIEGTLTHECLETFLKHGEGKMLQTGRFLGGVHPLERVVRAESAARAVWKIKSGCAKGSELLAETKSTLAHIHHDMHGTADAVVIEHFGTLHIIDYKNGRMPVEVAGDDGAGNPQLIFYALGIAHSYDYNFERVATTVIQPNAPHSEGPVRSAYLSIEGLREWALKFKAGVALAMRQNAPLNPGDHCFFCPAKTICKSYTAESVRSMRSKFIGVKSPEARARQLALDFGAYVDTPKTKARNEAGF